MSGRAHSLTAYRDWQSRVAAAAATQDEAQRKERQHLEQVRSRLILWKGASTHGKRSSTIVGVMRKVTICYSAHHPGLRYVIRCHLSTLMGRDKLRVTDVARLTGLNRSTIAALYQETATRVDLTSVDRLCQLFNCGVGELFEHKPNSGEG